MEINIGLPESSARGFWTTWAGFAVEASDDVARARRDMLGGWINAELCAGIRLEALHGRAEGVRKSRYSDCGVAREAAILLCGLTDCDRTVVGAVTFGVIVRLAARQHDTHMVDGDAIVAIPK